MRNTKSSTRRPRDSRRLCALLIALCALFCALPAPAIGEEGLRRLENALSGIPRREARREKPPALPVPEPVMSLRAAMTAPAEEVPAERSGGRVLADPCVSCPPAVPIVVSGERIGPDALRCFRYYGIERVSCVREPARAP